MAKNFAWIFSLVGGLLSMISLLAPASYVTKQAGGYSFSDYLWMWGFRTYEFGPIGSGTMWIYEMKPEWLAMILGVFGLISTLLILISGLVLFITALTSRKSGHNGAWLTMGILLIVGALFYIISYQIAYGTYTSSSQDWDHEWMNWWNTHDPGFSVIVPFITGFIMIIYRSWGLQ